LRNEEIMSKRRKDDLEDFERMLKGVEIPRARPEYLRKIYAISSLEAASAERGSGQRSWLKMAIPLGIAAAVTLVFWSVRNASVEKPYPVAVAQIEEAAPPLPVNVEPAEPQRQLREEPEEREEMPVLRQAQFVSARSKAIAEVYTLTMLSTNEAPRTLVFMGAESVMEPWKIRELAQDLALSAPREFQLSADYEKHIRKVEWKCKLSEEEARDYRPISEKSYWVATNDLGLARMSNGQIVRVLQEIWVDKQIALSREGGKVLEITQSRGELAPATLESLES
jgi:hypothetical protein